MRAVLVGAGALTALTARQLLKRDYDVVIIERNKERIDELSGEMAAGFIHGDGSKPAILGEADASATDFLFTLTGNDQTNIIAGLVGRSLGFKRVVPRIEDPAYEHICIELGLTDLVVPDNTIARYLADMVAGQNPLQLSGLIKGDARFFSFVIHEDNEGSVAELELPDKSRAMLLYRDEEFLLPEDGTTLKKDDEVVVVAHSKVLPELESRWGRKAR